MNLARQEHMRQVADSPRPIGFDDATFAPGHRGDVRVVGAVYAQTTLHGVVSGQVRREGRNSTDELGRLVLVVARRPPNLGRAQVATD